MDKVDKGKQGATEDKSAIKTPKRFLTSHTFHAPPPRSSSPQYGAECLDVFAYPLGCALPKDMLLRGASSPGEFLEKLEGGGNNNTKDGKFDSFSTMI